MSAPAAEGDPARGSDQGLRVTSLFNTMDGLTALLPEAFGEESWLDAFLLAAGMSQLLDEHLQADVLSLRRAAAFLAAAGGALGRLIASALVPLADALHDLRELSPSVRHVVRARARVAVGVDVLANLVVGAPATGAEKGALHALQLSAGASAAGRGHRLPRALREDVLRLPSCFRSFDQHPDDLRRVAADFAAAHPDRAQPLLVVGVRTSGSYLGPLYAAFLRAEGFDDATAIAIRPRHRLTRSDRTSIDRVRARDGLFLVCDDPPVSGRSVAAAAADLEDAGVARRNIVLLLALFTDAGGLPSSLAGFESVLLPHAEWRINGRVTEGGVRSTLAALMAPERVVTDVERIALRPPRTGRGHLKAVFRVGSVDAGAGERSETIAVEGVGIGYFGTHSLAVAAPLAQYYPRVLGVRDGLLVREWLPEEARADLLPPSDHRAVASRVVSYVLDRSRLLPLEADVTLHQAGQGPAWEVASTMLSKPFGRLWPLARAAVTNRVVKRVMRVSRPSLIDGRADLAQWFVAEGPGELVKVDWDEGSSWNLGLGCCDALFDLAGAAVAASSALAAEMQSAYATQSGEPVNADRWLLYQLAHLSARPTTRRETPHALLRARTRAMENYFHSVYFDDVRADPRGEFCGIDIDGVLETEHLGFPALTPSSAGALRALLAHGYQPLLVTGRSLGDVVDRCAAYRLPGGVAEYGAAIYMTAQDDISVATDPDEQAVIERLRGALRTHTKVRCDDDYAYAIRAFVLDRGRRRPLPAAIVAEVGRDAGAEDVSVIHGRCQTDFVARSTDKGRGTVALLSALDPEIAASPSPLAFAVGDTRTDVPFLRLARSAFAPGHAREALANEVRVTRASYQRGLAEAVGTLIGHPPGTCAGCRLPESSRERRQLLGLLGVRERGIWGVPGRSLKLMLAR